MVETKKQAETAHECPSKSEDTLPAESANASSLGSSSPECAPKDRLMEDASLSPIREAIKRMKNSMNMQFDNLETSPKQEVQEVFPFIVSHSVLISCV